MMTMLPSMVAIVLTWVFLGCSCVGLGWTVLRAAGSRIRGMEDGFAGFWVGWAAMIALLQIWQLFYPVGSAALVLVSVCGLACLLWGGCHIRLRSRAVNCQYSKADETSAPHFVLAAYSVVLAGFALWLANRAMGPLEPPYDAGLYHLNGIKWMREYPALPGLGNLHIRFATMPSYFLYMAFLESVPRIHRSWNAAHGLLLLASMAQILWSMGKAVHRRGFALRDLAAVLFLAPVMKFCFLETSSTAYDLPVFLLGFVMCVEVVRCWESGDDEESWRRAGMVVFALGAAAVTIKVSAAFLVVGAALVLAAGAFRGVSGGVSFWQRLVWWLPLPVALGVGWVVRNAVFSGYPFSPSTVAGLPVDWRVSAHALKAQMKVNMAWARDYRRPVDEVLANWDWFMPWLKGVAGYYWIEVTIPIALFVIALVFAGVALRRVRRSMGWRAIWPWAPAVLALSCWLITAPDQRFAGAAFWWLAAGAVVVACKEWGGVARGRCWLPVVIVSLGLTIWANGRLTKFTRPGPLEGGHYPIPEPRVKVFTTVSGLDVYVPVQGDQVWDSPLPATPYPNAALRLRRNGDLASGFVIGK